MCNSYHLHVATGYKRRTPPFIARQSPFLSYVLGPVDVVACVSLIGSVTTRLPGRHPDGSATNSPGLSETILIVPLIAPVHSECWNHLRSVATAELVSICLVLPHVWSMPTPFLEALLIRVILRTPHSAPT